MKEKHIDITYREYSGIEELQAEDKELAQVAIKAMKNAYASYSNFHVGAAIRMSDGSIVTGSNQENAAYPSGLCAERTAMFAASANHPESSMVSIAIAGGQNGILAINPATPCGACRQVMAQYQTKAGKNVSIIMIGASRIWKFSKVDDILPLIFDSI